MYRDANTALVLKIKRNKENPDSNNKGIVIQLWCIHMIDCHKDI